MTRSSLPRRFMRRFFCATALFFAVANACAQQNQTAAPVEWHADNPSSLIKARSGGDGTASLVMRDGVRVLAPVKNATPPSMYLYFDIDDARAATFKGPAYVTIEYFDDSLSTALQLEYDSTTGDDVAAAYRLAEDQAGGWLQGSGTWKKTIFLLDAPRFAGRQNLSADFRLQGGRLFIRRVQVTATRPADWDKVNKFDPVAVKSMVKIGAGRQLIVGAFDPWKASDAKRQLSLLEGSIPNLKALGVTSQEIYVRWNLCEPQEGVYDWSVFDRYVKLYKKYNLKWVPFLIVGPTYSLPTWFYKKPGSQGFVCLEHGEESGVQSLWNPVLKTHVSRFIKAFCEHYRDERVIETVLLGVSGNFGEAIYPVNGNAIVEAVNGIDHSHSGFWAGDKYALADFTRFLRAKYADDAALSPRVGEADQRLRRRVRFCAKTRRVTARGSISWIGISAR